MIKHVSLALNLRDGFLGRPIESAAGLNFTFAGEPIAPIFKEGGWCIFIDLPRGKYELKLAARDYVRACWALEIEAPETYYREEYATLFPSRTYPFGGRGAAGEVCFSEKGKPLAYAEVYIAPREQPLKLAQDGAAAGHTALKLFSAQRAGLLMLPDRFMIDDGAKSELVTLLPGEKEGEFRLEEPLRHPHSRGAAFQRVRRYAADSEGAIFLALQESAFTAYRESGKGYRMAEGNLKDCKDGRMTLKFMGGKHGVSGDA